MGVIAFLRTRRLDALHALLLDADPETTSVTDEAFRLGFAHLGRFAGSYRRRFGALPSETLARS